MVLSPRRRRGDFHAHDTDDDHGLVPIQFRLEARREWVNSHDGERLEGRGYAICDPRTGTPLGDDDFFFRIGGGIVGDLIGAEAHLAELQNRAFAPGRALALQRLASSPPDEPPVVEVFDFSRTLRCGRLPADAAEAVVFYGSESYNAAFCLWEWRTPGGLRVGLRLLLAPGWTVEHLPETPA